MTFYERRDADRAALLAEGVEIGPLEAAALGDVERLKTADLSARGSDGFTLLHLAAFFGGAEAVKVLLDRGMDANADNENEFGVHPIHSAAAADDTEAVKALLAAGADPTVTQPGGFTPLDSATRNGNQELIALLSQPPK